MRQDSSSLRSFLPSSISIPSMWCTEILSLRTSWSVQMVISSWLTLVLRRRTSEMVVAKRNRSAVVQPIFHLRCSLKVELASLLTSIRWVLSSMKCSWVCHRSIRTIFRSFIRAFRRRSCRYLVWCLAMLVTYYSACSISSRARESLLPR